MNLLVCIGYPATAANTTILKVLRQSLVLKGETCWFFIPPLLLHPDVIQAAAVDPWGCAGFHSSGFKTKFNKLLSNAVGGLLSCSSSTVIPFAYVYKAIEEGSISQNHRFGPNLNTRSR